MMNGTLRNIVTLLSFLVFSTTTWASDSTALQPDTSASGKFSWIALPYISASPETGFLLGLAGIMSVHLDDPSVKLRRASTISVGANISQLGQQLLATNFDVYFNKVRSRLNGRVGYEIKPQRYYGVGPNTREDDEVWYTPEYLKIGVSYFHRLIETEEGQGFTLGGRLEYWNTTMQPNDSIPPSNFAPPLGWNGGLSQGLGLVLTYDTRDNAYFPRKNMYVEVRSMSYPKIFGADFEYNRTWLDLRGYVHADVFKDMVFAGQLLFDVTIGNAPFYDLPTYGGDQQMRGILRGRYMDRSAVVGQLEMRTHIWWVLGLSAFVAAGDVYPSPRLMSLAHTKIAGGAGLRVYLDKEAGMIGRIDVGWSEWGTAGYLTFSEAF